jgi:hypothetical protein
VTLRFPHFVLLALIASCSRRPDLTEEEISQASRQAEVEGVAGISGRRAELAKRIDAWVAAGRPEGEEDSLHSAITAFYTSGLADALTSTARLEELRHRAGESDRLKAALDRERDRVREAVRDAVREGHADLRKRMER